MLYIHGSAVSAMLTTLATGVDACVTITLLDALVYSRTAFHHSVNYRSVIAFGRATEVIDNEIKLASLAALIEKVEPGRSRECRLPNPKELKATCVIAMPLTEASAKIRTGPPVADDTPEDAALPYWAGVIPLITTRGLVIASPRLLPFLSLAPRVLQVAARHRIDQTIDPLVLGLATRLEDQVLVERGKLDLRGHSVRE
jgi:nitroimidazol reductase NimA-like FMN-containing flavoprotein (pyridoxamine 5'-phosphate oxidase superfamily)